MSDDSFGMIYRSAPSGWEYVCMVESVETAKSLVSNLMNYKVAPLSKAPIIKDTDMIMYEVEVILADGKPIRNKWCDGAGDIWNLFVTPLFNVYPVECFTNPPTRRSENSYTACVLASNPDEAYARACEMVMKHIREQEEASTNEIV